MFTGSDNERVIHLECGTGLSFDSKIGSCNYDQLVSCDSNKPTEPILATTQEPTTRQTTTESTTHKQTTKSTTKIATSSSTVKCPTGKLK